MAKHTLKQFLNAFQAKLGLLLTTLLSDAHDALIYDSPIQRALTEQGIAYDNYALAPGFNYHNEEAPRWRVFVQSAGLWNVVMLPNPFYSAIAYSQTAAKPDYDPQLAIEQG